MRCPKRGCGKYFGEAYTKEQLEEDLKEVEVTRHTMRQALVLGVINGFDLNRGLDACDKRERKLHGKRWASGRRFQEMCEHMRIAHNMSYSEVEEALATRS